MGLPWQCHNTAIAVPWQSDDTAMARPQHCHDTDSSKERRAQRLFNDSSYGNTKTDWYIQGGNSSYWTCSDTHDAQHHVDWCATTGNPNSWYLRDADHASNRELGTYYHMNNVTYHSDGTWHVHQDTYNHNNKWDTLPRWHLAHPP